MDDRSRREGVEKVSKLIGNIQVAMLTTIDENGCLHSRPMMTQKTEFDGRLWFFTRSEAPKVNEIRHDQHVNLAYADPADNVYVSLSGTARMVQDRGKMEELWSPAHRAWFPDGLEDPSLGLLCVDVEHAEYWDSPSGMVAQAIGFTKAMLSGKPYGEEAADHDKVKF